MTTEQRFLVGLGFLAGAAVTVVVVDALVQVRRARAAELRARTEAVEAEIAFLERVDRLAQGNAAAAA